MELSVHLYGMEGHVTRMSMITITTDCYDSSIAVTFPPYQMGLGLTLWKAWFRRLGKDARQHVLDAFYQDPGRAAAGHYRTKMCRKFAIGQCKRGTQNAKPQASGVRKRLYG